MITSEKTLFAKKGTFNYSAIKKDKIFPFAATRMDLEGIMLSKISQIEKDNLCMTPLICGK